MGADHRLQTICGLTARNSHTMSSPGTAALIGLHASWFILDRKRDGHGWGGGCKTGNRQGQQLVEVCDQ